jgi:hypothetical protein
MAQAVDYDKIASQHGGKAIDYDALANAVQSENIKPHPESTIGPVPANAPVTLGDLIDNPKGAIQRMVRITKDALTDPKVMIPVAVSLGIGALAKASDYSPSMPSLPSTAGARNAIGRGLQTASESINPDLVSVLSPRAGAAMKAAGRLGKAMQTKPPPVEVAPAPASIPDAVPPPTPTAPPARAAAPTPKTANTPIEGAGEMPSLEDLQLTKAEIETAVKWHENGVSPETILHRILQSRQLTAKTRTTTPDQAAIEIEYMRTHQGRRQGE